MKPINEAAVTFLSRSANEGFARTAAACFAAQLDPTLDEVNDIKTAVSEAVTNCIVHAYPDRLGKVSMRLRLFEDNTGRSRLVTGVWVFADVDSPPAPLHHRNRGAQRHGLYHYGELYGRREGAFHPRQGHRGHPAAQGLPPDGGARVSVADTPALLEEARRGDNDACARLIEENAGLIWSIVRRYYGRGTDPEDLYQLGCLGFLKAVRGFDPAFGCQFSTYAVPKIAGEIRRFLRDDGAVKVSRGLKERAGAIRSARERLSARLGREPALSELAEETGLEPEEIAAAEEANLPVASLQMETGDGFTLESVLGTEGMEEAIVEREALRGAVAALPERERQVILLRYFRGMTQDRTAKVLGVSQVQVSRIERKAVEHLRRKLE